MSANEFGRETHWQIVRTDAEQPWHARLVSNYRTIMTSEKYATRRSALRAIELAAPEWLASKTPLEVDEREDIAGEVDVTYYRSLDADAPNYTLTDDKPFDVEPE